MENVDMAAARIAELVAQAADVEPAERVELLATAVGVAVDPLQRIRLLMLVADAAGRAAHDSAGSALRGQGMPDGQAATWGQIAQAAGLAKDTAFRQFHGGEALSWSTATRGVRQATRRPAADEVS
ncbi:hypothetical protein ACFYWP_36905 [Actinacidiphila glaucinigra]|uniref:hypothetical protein n=1 Tax=Actinacidiphila glaucinigra TaxID=235986 RepID=UPI003687687A